MRNRIGISLTLLVFAFILFACKKNEDLKFEGKIQFLVEISSLENYDAKFVRVSIMDEAKDKVYEFDKIEFYDFNTVFGSELISLKRDNYHLSRFMILNSEEEVIYACPVEGSKYSSLVENPLLIGFEIHESDLITKYLEVISVNNSSPEDFGYTTFNFD